MESLQELIAFALRASLFVTVLAFGLDASVEDATYVFRRPRLLLRSLVPIALVVPACAALMVAVLPLTPVVKIGILLMAVSPLPPLAPSKELKFGGRKPYVYGLLVAIAVPSIVLVPATVAILSEVFGKHVAVAPGPVARLMFVSVLIPLAIGMIVRAMWPARAAHAAPRVGKLANVVLVVSTVPVLLSVAPAIAHFIGDGTIIAMEVVAAVGLAAGHWLGGPDPHDRVTLAMASGTRHPGMALLIASANSTEPSVKAAILLFVIVGILTAIPYQIWAKRRVLAAQ